MTIEHLPVTGLPMDGVSPSVLVCGDPARADKIAAALDNAELVSHKREFRAHRGSYHGVPITVCSHGVGAPGAAIAVEELIIAGAKQIIRVGTCGGMQPDLVAGHIVIATAAVQNTGVGREIAPRGYPAVADLDTTLALRSAAARDSVNARHGVVLSRDAFYGGVPTPDAPDYTVMSAAGVLAVEMECAAVFIVGALRGIQTGAILVVDGNVLEQTESFDTYQPGQPVVQQGVQVAIQIALSALQELA